MRENYPLSTETAPPAMLWWLRWHLAQATAKRDLAYNELLEARHITIAQRAYVKALRTVLRVAKIEERTRDKRNCMHLGTGLCPKGEDWEFYVNTCDDCKYYLTKEGETNDRSAEEAA